ncbi:AsnC family transcriptional regulator, partial [Ochrobactrum sp. CDB2]
YYSSRSTFKPSSESTRQVEPVALSVAWSVYLMSGEYDYILRVAAKDLEDYERIHRDWLSALPHVVKINSSFALREIVDRPYVGPHQT